MKVLIIGGCGYIGSRIYDSLSEKYEVDSVDMEWFGNFVPNIKEDYNNLSKEFLSKYGTIILLAGQSSEKMCECDMFGTFQNHVSNFISLLEKIKNKNIRLIYASTCRVYYGTKFINAKETDVNFTSSCPYDINMYLKDLIIRGYDIEYYGLRLGTVNGYSRNFRKESLINSMFCSAKDNGFLEVSNGSIGRSVLDMEDLVKAINKILEVGSLDKSGVYNLCSLTGTVKNIGLEVCKNLNVEMLENADTDKVLSFSMDNSKFERVFDFKFNGSIDNIIKELSDNFNKMTLTSRVEKIPYVQRIKELSSL